jgi:TnpA family transposase
MEFWWRATSFSIVSWSNTPLNDKLIIKMYVKQYRNMLSGANLLATRFKSAQTITKIISFANQKSALMRVSLSLIKNSVKRAIKAIDITKNEGKNKLPNRSELTWV